MEFNFKTGAKEVYQEEETSEVGLQSSEWQRREGSREGKAHSGWERLGQLVIKLTDLRFHGKKWQGEVSRCQLWDSVDPQWFFSINSLPRKLYTPGVPWASLRGRALEAAWRAEACVLQTSVESAILDYFLGSKTRVWLSLLEEGPWSCSVCSC